jgi:hypothetical protein
MSGDRWNEQNKNAAVTALIQIGYWLRLLAAGSAISAAPGLDVPSVSQKRRFT